MENSHYASIKSLSELIRAQKVSPVELVELTLKRLDTYNSKLNAFITILANEARSAAHKAEAGKWRGPLHGVPVAVKDFYDTAGIKTTGGFEQFKDRVPAKDAPLVAKLKEAGAIIVGKTNMDALGMETTGLTSAFGPVHNPWHAEYVPGGSSAGSAAAVATGLCYATVDTDAVGSTRLPAACCGVVGLKTSAGLIDGSGVLEGTQDPGEMIHLLSHVGITARTTEDAAVVLAALAKKPFDYAAGIDKPDHTLRIGIAKNITASDEVLAIFTRAVEVFEKFGYSTREVTVPMDRPKFEATTIEKDRAEIGALLFKDIDVLLTPTLVEPVITVAQAQSRGRQAVSPANTFFVNYFSLAAITVPAGFTDKGLPQGLQLVCRAGREADLLKIAYEYEHATEWGSRRPELS